MNYRTQKFCSRLIAGGATAKKIYGYLSRPSVSQSGEADLEVLLVDSSKALMYKRCDDAHRGSPDTARAIIGGKRKDIKNFLLMISFLIEINVISDCSR